MPNPTPARCTWAPDTGWLTPEGRPCPRAHCAMRGRCVRHVTPETGELACPSCIGRVRREIQQVHQLAPSLPVEATHAGVDSEAANLAGPCASAEQVLARAALDPALELDGHHPTAVLTRWEVRVREAYGPEVHLFGGIDRAAAYLSEQLGGPFPHTQEFEAFATEVSDCLTHIEAVLHNARGVDRGAQCPTCLTAGGADSPWLRKRHAEHGASPCPRTQARACRVCSGLDDTWHCPGDPGHWWHEADYRARVEATYLEHAERLTASDLERQHGVPPSTLRSWIKRGQLHQAGKDPDGRVLYPVAEVLARRAEDQSVATARKV